MTTPQQRASLKTYRVKTGGLSQTGRGIIIWYKGRGPVIVPKSKCVCLQDPRPGREIDIMIPDSQFVKHVELCGVELYVAERKRWKDLRKARLAGEKEYDRRFKKNWGRYDLLDHLRRNYWPTEQEIEDFYSIYFPERNIWIRRQPPEIRSEPLQEDV